MKNSIVFTLLLFGLTSLLLFPSAPGPSNLIMNPGFEASFSVPPGWLIKGPISSMEPATSVDNEISYEGSYALKMVSLNPKCHGRASQKVGITGGQSYLFTARFRAEGVRSIDAFPSARTDC